MIPGWTAALVARRDPCDMEAFEQADFAADMAELHALAGRIFARLDEKAAS